MTRTEEFVRHMVRYGGVEYAFGHIYAAMEYACRNNYIRVNHVTGLYDREPAERSARIWSWAMECLDALKRLAKEGA